MRPQLAEQAGGQRQRGDEVDLEHPAVRRRVELGQAGLRAGTQGAGVVHQQPGTAEAGRGVHQVAPVPGVGDVPRHDAVRAAVQALGGVPEHVAVPGVEDQVPAAAGQLVGQRQPQSLGGAGDDCSSVLVMSPPSNLNLA